MSEEQKPLERRHVLAIKIGGDTPEDVIGLLKHFLFEFEVHGLHTIISGGFSSGGNAVYAENDGVTHESYFEEVEAWMEARREKDEEADCEAGGV